MMGSQPLYLASAGMANQSTLGAIEPLTIFASIIFARFILNESLTKFKMFAMALFAPGMVLTLLFASMETNRLDRKEFDEIFYGWLSMTYLFTTLGVVSVFTIISHFIVGVHPDEDYDEFKDEEEDTENGFSGTKDNENDKSLQSKLLPRSAQSIREYYLPLSGVDADIHILWNSPGS